MTYDEAEDRWFKTWITAVRKERAMIENIKTRLKIALKEKNEIEKNILRLVLGEVQTIESKEGMINEQRVIKIISKIIESNNETLSYSAISKRKDILVEENKILTSLLPKAMTSDEVEEFLVPYAAEIKAANSEGQGTGLAMKKLQGKIVNGKAVNEVVRKIREKDYVCPQVNNIFKQLWEAQGE